MKGVVVDASVAIKWLVLSGLMKPMDVDKALALFEQISRLDVVMV
jgi:hypothetical protein